MRITNKIFRSRFGILVALLALIIAFYIGSIFIISQYKRTAIKSFNEEIVLRAKLSTRAIAQNYDLYFDSGLIKLKETTQNILGNKEIIKKFQIIDTEGYILYDSSTSGREGKVSKDYLDILRAPDPNIVYTKEGDISSIIYPYIEDWGAHKYSVKYIASSKKLKKDISAYKREIYLIGILFLFLSFFPILAVFYYRELEHDKEDKKRLRELNSQKDNFMTLVAHNLRTPISIMKGYANLAEEKSLKGIEKEYVDAIIEATNRLNSVTETIIKVNEILSSGKIIKYSANFPNTVREVIENYQRIIKKKKIKLSFKEKSKINNFNFNKEYIEKTISSLIDNAIKFNKAKGKIYISIEEKDKFALFEIKDTGIGIKDKDLKTIFTSFHRAVESPLNYDYSGLGMGLYLAKVIVEAHGGNIWVESTYKKGSTFRFTLPLKN